ncbi:hypothetical protein GYMLUDRAFT_469240 [Collybiopsis luxurians FD-317 M1]|uniref:Uncharacterized protein n=1 Tax=Collybiopsis luxurians FD-317 M1 TaxID=944289 RepID=A0A0D0B873_9AGAR|nr:hypothetical protein GYMLUDRAFT_469240 [Collybiopsis luxurians FD-317 M1]
MDHKSRKAQMKSYPTKLASKPTRNQMIPSPPSCCPTLHTLDPGLQGQQRLEQSPLPSITSLKSFKAQSSHASHHSPAHLTINIACT